MSKLNGHALIRYDTARRALAEAKAVDEVKEIRNAAIAMAAYAKQAKDRGMEADAAEIRLRATRRLGEMMQAQKGSVGLNKGAAVPTRVDGRPTLTSQGIDKHLADEARKLGRMTEDEFEQQVEEAREYVAYGKREILEAAKEIRAEKTAENWERWKARNIELSKVDAPLPERRFPVILADPPLEFRVFDAASGSSRCPDAHYPTMSLDEICAMPVEEIATPDAALFLWTTAATFPESLDMVKAWGFQYVTHLVWVKHTHGLGFWIRNQHEVLIIAKRGNMRSPLEADRPSSVIQSPRREHSRKPDEAYEIIERMYPDLPKLELFARKARPGWLAWGNELPSGESWAQMWERPFDYAKLDG
jgi:N6-adenosine-specific RNA methylase IME4